jgi:RimJ/RimL family protein N-acetyltransferase
LTRVIELRTVGPDDWPLWRAVRLEALAEAPAAFSSRLADWQGPGDTEARWRTRLLEVPYNVVALADSEPVGQVSGTALDAHGAVELISLWLAPSARGSGLADELVGAVVQWARAQGAIQVVLSVRATNDRARRCYDRLGFAPTGRARHDGETELRRRL